LLDADADRADLELRLIKLSLKDPAPVHPFASNGSSWRQAAVHRDKATVNRRFTSKTHVIVDALGNPLRLILTGGQVHDITQAEVLLGLFEPGALLADKGYDADHFADGPIPRAIKVVTPPKQNRKVNSLGETLPH
jgi:hypothetical protein